ncbi:hypothetical protein [Escherichia coli]|uniref:hypothetical protein n=1 Tax=Escherichia coli TaxID=562 RepID=UPI00201B1560|nr:hypothetical protein [Escherichia coli]
MLYPGFAATGPVRQAVAVWPAAGSEKGDGEYRREQQAGPRKTLTPRLPILVAGGEKNTGEEWDFL